jgi:hypothetical protein
MAITAVAGAELAEACATGVPSTAIDSTGGNFIVLSVSYITGSVPTITDSKGNTYGSPIGTPPSAGGLVSNAEWRVLGATCGTGHTFTITHGGPFLAFAVKVFAGVATSAADDQTPVGNATTGQGTIAPGSLTPSVNDTLVTVTAMCSDGQSLASIDGGFSTGPTVPATGSNFGCGIFFLIQTTAAAAGPTVTLSSASTYQAAMNANFKAAAAGGAAPFVPTETTTVPRAHSSMALRSWSNNLLSTTLAPAPAAMPFTPQAWPNPHRRGFSPALRTWQTNYQLDDNVPFVPETWDLPRVRASIAALRTWHNNLLESTLAPTQTPPFASGEWTMPVPKVSSRALRTWVGTRVRTLLAEVPPPTQAAGPNVPGRSFARSLHTWGNNLLETTLAPPTVPGVFRRSINTRVGSRSQE